MAGQGGVISGEVPLDALQRVADLLLQRSGNVEFDFRFSKDDNGRILIDGLVRADLVIQCQRCLEAMTLVVDASPQLAVIETAAEADRIPEACDPVFAEAGSLSIVDLIEDELLLAIPQVPMHAESDCEVDLASISDPPPEQSENEAKTENPFAALSALRTEREN
ncbi:MAG: DUF177 domain-containing protein [Gammaproteobacteria bacterium]|nr:DUF177 domain-containing protein [Gammaproteobacteria bacterium]